MKTSAIAVAIDTLEQIFIKAKNDLSYVQGKLETEFNGKQVDPFKLLMRIKKIQDELPQIEHDYQKVMDAKQDLIDKTKEVLIGNRAVARRMYARTGAPISCDADDDIYSSFMKVIQEWNDQLQSDIGTGNDFNESEDLNQKLFS